MSSRAKIPLWIDCDPGHDDACALLLAAYHPRLELLGVSTTHGNTSLTNTTNNALAVLEAIGRPEIPVVPGSHKPFCREPKFAPTIHGENGLGGTDLLPQPQRSAVRHVSAINAIRNAIVAQPAGKAWLVVTGPMTNAALLFAVYPEVVEHIAGLSIMGGAIGNGFSDVYMGQPYEDGDGEKKPRIGNMTPFAEFNIWADPEAAQSVFSIPTIQSKTTLITLDLSHQACAGKGVRDLLLRGGKLESEPISRLRRMFHELLMFFADTYATEFGLNEGPPLHDPLAVAALLSQQTDPEMRIDFDDHGGERWEVEVLLEGVQAGRTVATPSKTGIVIPRRMALGRFWAELEKCMEKADAATNYASM